MSLESFDNLPDHARLWVFPADRVLTPAEIAVLSGRVEASLADWNAHGSPVTWGYRVTQDQFLMIGVDESRTALSGCSIDNAIHRLEELESELGVGFLDNGRVFYRTGDGVAFTDRAAFRSLADEGAVTGDTLVFNNVITTVGDLRQGLWEIPARDSWHARAFSLTA